jgi:hypothetical protein
MDKLFIVLAGRHGYTPTIYGIYNDKLLADKRGIEVVREDNDDTYYEIIEVNINIPIELNI